MKPLRDRLRLVTKENLRKSRRHPLREIPWFIRQPPPDLSQFYVEPEDVSARSDTASNDLERLFYDGDGREVSKWSHYFDIYDRHFAGYRGRPVRMLEIGVSQGGSLDLWRSYFGPDAVIVGIDIDPGCADRVSLPNIVRIGSQDDPAFLAAVCEEFGPFDIILDDGSHIGRHEHASFQFLFPRLAPDGLYAIEDLHTSYWPGNFQGGYRRAGTGMSLINDVLDDMHAWYHGRPTSTPAKESIVGVHAYDSIVLFEKGVKRKPETITVPERRNG